MTPEEWCKALCARISAVVSEEAPRGLGTWDRAWEIVAEPSEALMVALRDVEQGKGSRREARRLGIALRDAWRQAGREYLEMLEAAAEEDSAE